jgi:hypothetical protein
MISLSTASDALSGVKIRTSLFYKGVFIIAPSFLNLGNRFNSFKIVTGRWRLDGATEHI